MNPEKSLAAKISAYLRLALAFLMVLGNPSLWLGLAFSTPVRLGLASFAVAMLSSAQAFARQVRKETQSNQPQVVFKDLSGLSDDPTDRGLEQIQYFGAKFIPTSASPISGENAALAKALKATVADPQDETLQNLEDFVAAYPASRWVLSVELNRGLELYRKGHFSRCVEAFKKAWETGKGEEAPQNPELGPMDTAKGEADLALAEWTRMDCRVGRKLEATRLLGYMKGRGPAGVAGQYYEMALYATRRMSEKPELSFLCGPYALGKILAFGKSPNATDPALAGYRSTDHGVSLDNLWKLSQELGMNFQIAKRAPGSQVILPAVVNWKLGHYAALVERKGVMIHSEDPTFGNDSWLSVKTLDDETSGYFLVPDGPLPQGWEKVGLEEASQVWGKGIGQETDPPIPCPNSSSCGCSVCSGHAGGAPSSSSSSSPSSAPSGGPAPSSGSAPVGISKLPKKLDTNKKGYENDALKENEIASADTLNEHEASFGMPRADLDLDLAAVMIHDTPLEYKPPVGPYMAFTLTYHQKTPQPLPYSNFGSNWNFNWQGYIQYNFSNNVASNFQMFSAGGGEEAFTPAASLGAPVSAPSSTAQGFTQFSLSQIAINSTFNSSSGAVSNLPSSFIRQFPDGWQEVYGRAVVGASQVTLLLTQLIDPYGNAAVINYDNYNRISTITDALGQTTTFSYGDSSNPTFGGFYLVTQITDPYGRTAVFTYSNGLLMSIEDMLGMTSSFTYVGVQAFASWRNRPRNGAGIMKASWDGSSGPWRFLKVSEAPNESAAFTIPSDWVTTMTTPYGTTNFYYGNTTGTALNSGAGTAREAEIDDPDGSRRHAVYGEQLTLPETFSNVPSNINTAYLNPGGTLPTYADILYWDRTAMADAPLSPSSATDYRYIVTTNLQQSFILGSLKKPLESRIWYSNIGNPTEVTQATGSNDTFPQPIAQARFLEGNNGALVQQTTYTTYNSYGKVLSMTDPKGRVYNYTYASNGIDLLNVTDTTSGTVTLASYAGYVNHLPASYTDAAGQTWNYTYNGYGELLSVNTPMNETTTYNYDSNGFLTSIIPPQPGAAVTFTPDALERVASRSDAVNGTISYQYDNGDRVTKVTYADNSTENYVYYRLDVVSYTDRQNRTTNYAYDQEDRLHTVTDPKSQTTVYNWCTCGALASIQDPKSNTTSFTRDVEGRVTQKSYADGSSYAYQFEPTGTRIGQMTDAKGQVTQYGYDVDDTLLTVGYSNAAVSTAGVTFGYDVILPRLTSMSDGTGTTSYSYWPFGGTGGGSVDQVTSPVGSTSANIVYGYDNDSRVTSRNISGTSETYGYTNAELTQVANPLGTFNYTYDTQSARLTGVSYPNGQSVTYSYYTPSSGSGRLQSINNLASGGATLSYFNYSYDYAGEITQWVKQLGVSTSSAVTNNYGYDPDSELAAVTQTFASGATSQTSNFTYDPAGNRTEEQLTVGATGSPQAGSFTHTFATNNLNQLTNETASPISVIGSTASPATVTVNATPVPEGANNSFATALSPSGGSSTPLTIQATGTNGASGIQRNHVLNTEPFVYDANGNLLTDQMNTYSWDAANRLVGIHVTNPQPEV